MISGPAQAMEILMGTVHSVDREQGIIVLGKPENSGFCTACSDMDDQAEMTVNIRPEDIPDDVAPGQMLRVWGEYNGQIFEAESVRGRCCGMGRGNDPTGVRSRLGRGRGGGGMGMGNGHHGGSQ